MRKLLTFAFIFSFIIYFLSSAGKTPYDYFTRLGDAFLHGRYFLTQNPSWLNELIPAGQHKFYVVYPPMPGVLAMPLLLIFGQNFEQQYLAHLVGAGIVVLTMLLSWKIKRDKALAIWSGLLVGFGTIIWFLSATGSVWYLGQISSAFFLTAALVESQSTKRPLLIGIFLGAAYLSRLQTILSLPLFLYFLKDRSWFKQYIYLASGILPFVIFNMWYNFVRFGVVWDKAYFLIPGVLSEPWYKNGLFNLSYIPSHLKTMFASFPRFNKNFPYVTPSWAGLSIWITTPAFVYALSANIKERIVQISWLSIILIALLVFSHGTTGFAQFGYRFAVDFYPILIFLTIKGVAKSGLKWHHWLLLFFGVIINLWGVLWINKFGWISF